MAPASATDESVSVDTRDGTKADLAFVYATWLRSYRHNSRFARRITSDTYYALHHTVLERLFARGAKVMIAHPQGDPGTIVGYVVTEDPPEGTRIAGRAAPSRLLHFIYVKGPFRRLGIARALVQAARIDPENVAFTHLTADGEAIWAPYPTAEYWPHLAF